MTAYKAGFVNIIGKPNAGKSTLMNALVGEKLAIATPKAQTTRHRIIGIVSGEGYQIVYSDTPGILEPRYRLHKSMMEEVNQAMNDGDILLCLADAKEKEPFSEETISDLVNNPSRKLLVVNKADLSTQEELEAFMETWKQRLAAEDVLVISALHTFNLERLTAKLIDMLPEHPAYYGEDELTDKSERFLASEIVREQIFLQYRQEVPYSTEVIVSSFKDEPDILRIEADIMVERASQKGILIGHKGEALKQVGIAARKDLEKFFSKKIYLGLHVRIKENWRDNSQFLQQLGYHAK